ncbi:MAG: hypothetical protein WC846_03490 [Candidatus Gracilibacteria bacterium]|jgi:hypothetical protein
MPLRFFKDRIIAYKNGDSYLAVSLEFDLLASGDSIKEALDRLYDATTGYLKTCCLESESDREIYRKAPKKYQDLYELFVDLGEKKRMKEGEKKQEEKLLRQETHTAQFTFSSEQLCYA